MKSRILAVIVCGASLLATTGCDTQATLASLAQTLGSASAKVATLEGNPTLSAQLTTDTTAAVSAIDNWKSGTAADDVIQALSIVEDDLNLFPAADQYAPLIDIAIGTTQTLIAMLPAPAAAPAAIGARAVRATHPHRQVTLSNPPKNAKAFKAQWNAMTATNPALATAAIK